ncbi:peptidase family C50-domain-containing protein [Scheffersomyces amazonensis]|uniref:peptidase family C50-domain-containing protein n=1 Tax=Scheffersomyces amazonensis TaxID=1078765 RepID=UPI00315C4C5A
MSSQNHKQLFADSHTRIDQVLSRLIKVEDIERITNCFQYLHSYSPSRDQSIMAIKKHQMFIIKLVEIKQYTQGIRQLNYLQLVFNKILNDIPMNWNDSVDSWVEIPFNEEMTQTESVPQPQPQLVNLVVSFHFLYLQCLLQSISSNIKLVVSNKDSLLNMSIFKSIPLLFLNNGHFIRWLNLAIKLSPNNEPKYMKNSIKMINGFIVIIDSLNKKIQGSNLKVYKCCLKMKLAQFTGEEYKDWDIIDDGYIVQFLQDLHQSEYPHIESIMKYFSSTSIDEFVQTLQAYSRTPSISLINQLQLQLMTSPTIPNDKRALQHITDICLLNNELSYSFINVITSGLSSYLNNIHTLNSNHIRILDHITIFIKAISKDIQDWQTIKQTFINLHHIFYQFQQVKRIRNLSNILYNIGNKTLNFDIISLCLTYEIDIYNISKSIDDTKALKLKVQNLSNSLCEAGLADKSVVFIKLYLDFIDKSISNIVNIDNIFLQLIAKCISMNPQVSITLFNNNNEYSDGLKSSLVIRLFSLLEKSTNCEEKTRVINHLVDSLSFNDPNLYYLIQYHYFNINGLTTIIDSIPPPLPSNDINDLLKCGCDLQRMINFNYNDSLLNDCIQTFLRYISEDVNQQVNIIKYNQYEQDIFRSLISYLKFNGTTGYLIHVIDVYRANRSLSNSLDIFIQTHYCEALLKLSLVYDAGEALQTLNNSLKVMKINSLVDILACNLIQIEYFIKTNELQKAVEKYNKSFKALNSRGEHNLILSDNVSMIEKLTNLLLIAKFQVICCKLNGLLHNSIDAFKCIRIAIKIGYSIIKKSGPNIPKHKYNEIKWETIQVMFECYRIILSLLNQLGISRDHLFYFKEFDKANDSTWSPIVNCINSFDMLFYRVCMNDNHNHNHNHEYSNHLLKAESYNSVDLVHNNLSVHYKSHNMKGLINSTFKDFELPKFKSKNEITESILFNSYRLDHDDDSIVLHAISVRCQSTTFTFNYNRSTGLLNSFVHTKVELNNLIKSISQISQLTNFNDSVQSLPNIVSDGFTNVILDNEDILNKLIQIKDDLMGYINNPQFKSFAIYQIRDLSNTLTRCLLTISSMSIFKNNTNILHELYYLQDLYRALPFNNDKLISHVSTNFKDILPSELQIKPQIDFHNQAVSFNIDLNLYLPENWSIITLDICPFSGNLVLSKFIKGSYPINITLSLNRTSSTKKNESQISFDDMKKNFLDIIKQSDISTKASTTSKITSREERKSWWKLRFHLDLRMKDLLEQVENQWLGGFTSIFNNYVKDSVFAKFKSDFIKTILGSLPSRIENTSSKMQFDDELLGLFYNMKAYDINKVNDILYFLIDSLLYHAELNSFEEINISKLHKNLELIFDKYFNLRTSKASEHLILVPSSSCNFFPWESLNCLSGKSVSRVPSIDLLIQMLKNRKSETIDKSKLYYMINPGGDLRRTEEKFKPMFNKWSTWNGLVGEKPNEANFMDNLSKTNLFVYLGHGGCDQYLKTATLFKTCLPKGPKLPPSLLIGCSSGALTENGIFEPHGNVYNWLTCGTPMVLVNLWDVTDKDIDQFSLSVFEKWGLFPNQPRIRTWNICEAVGSSRKSCTLPYLNGSAPIVYGLPLVIGH